MPFCFLLYTAWPCTYIKSMKIENQDWQVFNNEQCLICFPLYFYILTNIFCFISILFVQLTDKTYQYVHYVS